MMFLLCRTDPAAPKHRGISYLIVAMETPGIEVRPIRQISGTSEFCETFFSDVRTHVSNVVGTLGAGWPIANSTLSSERSGLFTEWCIQFERDVEDLVAEARGTGNPRGHDAARPCRPLHHEPHAPMAERPSTRRGATRSIARNDRIDVEAVLERGSHAPRRDRCSPCSALTRCCGRTARATRSHAGRTSSCGVEASRSLPVPARSSATSSLNEVSDCPANRRTRGRSHGGLGLGARSATP